MTENVLYDIKRARLKRKLIPAYETPKLPELDKALESGKLGELLENRRKKYRN